MACAIHVYAGTAGHSAWFSEDAGITWTHPNSHSGMYLEARVWCFAMHPKTPTTLYAGTDTGLFGGMKWQHDGPSSPRRCKTSGQLRRIPPIHAF
jgi:hypothetical protein